MQCRQLSLFVCAASNRFFVAVLSGDHTPKGCRGLICAPTGGSHSPGYGQKYSSRRFLLVNRALEIPRELYEKPDPRRQVLARHIGFDTAKLGAVGADGDIDRTEEQYVFRDIVLGHELQ
jgi:hypothetical protein